MQEKGKNCTMQRCSQVHKVGIEASEGSGVQGLDPSQKSWPFIWLESMKEC